jgi:ribosomal protein S18 acetylase RimI-like enzyme
MSFRIREVAKKDRAGIISIIESAPTLAEREKNCAVAVLDEFLNGSAEYMFLAAAGPDNAPCGYVSFGMDAVASGAGEIYWIIVAPGARGSGVGAALMKRAEAALGEKGARIAVVETSGIPSYEEIRRFYVRVGYREEARVVDYFAPGDDKIIYVKRLTFLFGEKGSS